MCGTFLKYAFSFVSDDGHTAHYSGHTASWSYSGRFTEPYHNPPIDGYFQLIEDGAGDALGFEVDWDRDQNTCVLTFNIPCSWTIIDPVGNVVGGHWTHPGQIQKVGYYAVDGTASNVNGVVTLSVTGSHTYTPTPEDYDFAAADVTLTVGVIFQGRSASSTITGIEVVTKADTFVGSGLDSELSFVSDDIFHCHADTANADGQIPHWHVEPESDGLVPTVTDYDGADFDLTFAEVLGPPDPHQQRPRLRFNLQISLSGMTQDTKEVVQDERGQLRQEYEDYPLAPPPGSHKIPDPGEFTNQYEAGSVYNHGDYSWSIVTPWAINTIQTVNAAAQGAGLIGSAGLGINSVFRGPRQHWLTYDDLIRRHKATKVNVRSQHLWGAAVDFAVSDFDHKNGITRKDWKKLFNLCKQLGLVAINEKRADHVHVQRVRIAGVPAP